MTIKRFKYDIYCIGHALIDIDFKVTTQTLKQHGIEKGTMTLIDYDRCHQLLTLFANESRAKVCGGSAANTAILLSQLGGCAFYSGVVGNDQLGNIFCQELKRQAVATNMATMQRPDGMTGTCLVMVTPDADRTMNTYAGVNEQFSKNHIDEYAICHSQYFYIEGYLIQSDLAYEAILHGCELAQKHHTKIVLTLSDHRLVASAKERLLRIISYGIDLLFCNAKEARVFCQSQSTKIVSQLLLQYAKRFVMTKGANGAIVFDGKQLINSNAYQVNTLDSVGAGDTFAGSFCYGITHGMDFATAANLANFTSSLVVTKYGPRLHQNEIDRIKKTMFDHLPLPQTKHRFVPIV